MNIIWVKLQTTTNGVRLTNLQHIESVKECRVNGDTWITVRMVSGDHFDASMTMAAFESMIGAIQRDVANI